MRWIGMVALLIGCTAPGTPDAGAGPACSWSGRAPCMGRGVPVCGDAWRVACDYGVTPYATHGCPEQTDGGLVCPDGSEVECRSPAHCNGPSAACGVTELCRL